MAKKLTPVPSRQASKPCQVYLAGPLFTLTQLWLLNEVKRALESQGLIVFSPKDEVGFLSDPSDSRRVAEADLRGLDRSQLVFAILDGFDPGTVFEVGYARANGIPVVGFAEHVHSSDLTMLEGTDCDLFDDLPTAVYQTVWKSRE